MNVLWVEPGRGKDGAVTVSWPVRLGRIVGAKGQNKEPLEETGCL